MNKTKCRYFDSDAILLDYLFVHLFAFTTFLFFPFAFCRFRHDIVQNLQFSLTEQKIQRFAYYYENNQLKIDVKTLKWQHNDNFTRFHHQIFILTSNGKAIEVALYDLMIQRAIKHNNWIRVNR